jgi:hypothetical protein
VGPRIRRRSRWSRAIADASAEPAAFAQLDALPSLRRRRVLANYAALIAR